MRFCFCFFNWYSYKSYELCRRNKNLVSKALFDQYISQDDFVSVNNALREYDDMKEEVYVLKNILILEIEFTKTNYEKLE